MPRSPHSLLLTPPGQVPPLSTGAPGHLHQPSTSPTPVGTWAGRSHLDLKANAFRTLGLDADAQPSVACYRADRLRAALREGRPATFWSDSPIFVPVERTLEGIGIALRRLEDPLTRLLDEASWFHFSGTTDIAAMAMLARGNKVGATALWDDAIKLAMDTASRLHYEHNRAVLYLWLAEMPARPVELPRDAWERAVEAWVPLLRDDAFWRDFVDRSPGRRNPRVQAAAPFVVRAEVAYVLARGCGHQAVERVAARHAEVFDGLAQFIRTRLEAAQALLAGARGPFPAIESLEPRLCFSRMAFDQVRSLRPTTSPGFDAAADLLGDVYRRMALYYAAQPNGIPDALTLAETARDLPVSGWIQDRIKEDARRLRWTMAVGAFKKALEAGDSAGAEDVLEVLDRNKDPDAGPEVLGPFRREVEKLRDLRTEMPAVRILRVVAVCGTGTRLYGRRAQDPGTGSYVATRWLTVLCVPILALGRYRVRQLADGRYGFSRPLPLSWWERTLNVLALLVFLALLAVAALAVFRAMPSLRGFPSPPDRADEARRRVHRAGRPLGAGEPHGCGHGLSPVARR